MIPVAPHQTETSALAQSSIPFIKRGNDGHFLIATISWRTDTLVEVGSGHGGRYIIMLPVLDYVRLGQEVDGGRLGILSEDDVSDLVNGKALLVLDLSNEGPTYDRPIFETLHANLDRRGISRKAVVFVNQNKRLQVQYNTHHGPGILFWPGEYFVIAVAAWMAEPDGRRLNGERALDRHHYAPLDRGEDLPSFLCQNAAVRWHRVLLYRWLQTSGLTEHGMVSFYGIGQDNSKANEIDISQPPANISAGFPDLLEGIEDWIPRRARRVDNSAGSGNDLVLTLDIETYSKTDLAIVSESDFFVPGIERVTEKAIKAAGMGVPFIIVGAARSVQRLAEFGFCTFDGLINHSYDLIEDPVERMKAVFATIENVWGRISAHPHTWRAAAHDQALANFQHGKTGLFPRVNALLTDPMATRLRTFVETGIVTP